MSDSSAAASSALEVSSTAACEPGRKNPPSKKGKKAGITPRPRDPTIPDPHTAAWCTASNPNPGAELQPGLRPISSLPNRSKRLPVVTGRRGVLTIGIAVRGRTIPPLATVRGTPTICETPACGAAIATLGATAAACETGAIAPRSCACTPTGRKAAKPARRIWRTIVIT